MPQDVVEPVTVDADWSDAPSEPPPGPDIPWLQPYPDHLLEPPGPHDAEPEEVVVSRETIEIAYLTAIQQLPPRQRAALVLRHTLGWSAKDTAAALDMSVPAVNSALQRARATLERHLPRERHEWTPVRAPTPAELTVLRRFMEAWNRADASALVSMMREDARWMMPPYPLWFEGRAAIAKLFDAFPIGWQGELRVVPTAANGSRPWPPTPVPTAHRTSDSPDSPCCQSRMAGSRNWRRGEPACRVESGCPPRYEASVEGSLRHSQAPPCLAGRRGHWRLDKRWSDRWRGGLGPGVARTRPHRPDPRSDRAVSLPASGPGEPLSEPLSLPTGLERRRDVRGSRQDGPSLACMVGRAWP
jgi:hypothetical protein